MTVPSDVLAIRRLADVEMLSIEWLERPLWQQAAFHLMVGRKGAGKGTYVARLAARVSRGELYGRPMNVLLVATEDSDEIDIKPRLVAAGGDPERIYSVNEAMLLPRDVDKMRRTALAIGEIGLLVLDPIASHVRGDTHGEDPVRNAIDPLNGLAHELKCLLIGVRHLSEKDATKGALAAVLGSSAWVQVPRAVVAVAPDDETDLLFHIAVAAGNRSARGAGRTFRIELADVGLKEPVTRAVEIGDSAKSVDELLGCEPEKRRAAVKRDGAADIILRELVDEPRPLDYLKAICAAEVGASSDTTWRAANVLKAAGAVDRRNSGPGSPWLWYMRKSDDHGPDFGTNLQTPHSQLDTEVTDLRTEDTCLLDFDITDGNANLWRNDPLADDVTPPDNLLETAVEFVTPIYDDGGVSAT
jgi:hypothetical protein